MRFPTQSPGEFASGKGRFRTGTDPQLVTDFDTSDRKLAPRKPHADSLLVRSWAARLTV